MFLENPQIRLATIGLAGTSRDLRLRAGGRRTENREQRRSGRGGNPIRRHT